MIVVVSPEQAALSWAIFEPMFRKVTEQTRGCYEPIDVLAEIVAGQQVMWAAWDQERGTVDAVMTTKLQDFIGVGGVLRRRLLNVIYVAGERMEAWLPEFVATIEKYARDKGATGGTGSFRRGWLRAWPGAQENGVNIFRDLTQ